MPYPVALGVNQLDLPRIAQAAASVTGQNIQNQLGQAKLQDYGDRRGRQNRLAPLIPGIAAGDEDAIVQAGSFAPEETAQYVDLFSKMDERQRAKFADTMSTVGGMLMAVETADPLQRPQVYQSVRQQAAQAGLDMTSVPESYDQNWIRMQLGKSGQLMMLLKQSQSGGFNLGPGQTRFDASGKSIASLPAAPKAPALQTLFDEEGREYKGRFNSDTGGFDRVGGFKARSGGNVTLAQKRENAEIDQARAVLAKRNLSPDDIRRLSQSATNTGRTNNEYEEYLKRVVTKATSRKTGDDPGFQAVYSKYLSGKGSQSGLNDFSNMSIDEIVGVVNGTREGELSAADLNALDARLKALGR